MGASGYGGVFGRFAERLADDFTVITYDRRGNGRSPRPPGWSVTSAAEQADDAAALLEALGFAPAVVFGTSSGGIFALELTIRHSTTVRAAILHEPALFALFDEPDALRSEISRIIQEGLAAGGPRVAFERFLRLAAGDANWDELDAGTQEQLLASAETYFGYEVGRFDDYVPGASARVTAGVPLEILISEDSVPEFAQAARRLAEHLRAPITQTPGTHFAYVDHPDELAQAVKAATAPRVLGPH
jgi:pimeloyl-ACP methyl ester carboxylesterase